jgi:hypothetical protein
MQMGGSIKMNIDEEREFCDQVYKKWDFIKRIVELYAEGVSWKGCNVTGIEAIKDGVRSMLVTGEGDFKIEKRNETVRVQMPGNPFEGPGHPFLWPVTQNAPELDKMEKAMGPKAYSNPFFEFIAGDICRGLGMPLELLGPKAAEAHGDAVMGVLITFRGHIRQWREYLGHRLKLNWNEEWFQQGYLAAYGPVYQVFKAQGIELSTLAKQVLSTAKSMLDTSLIPKLMYDQAVKWFG